MIKNIRLIRDFICGDLLKISEYMRVGEQGMCYITEVGKSPRIGGARYFRLKTRGLIETLYNINYNNYNQVSVHSALGWRWGWGLIWSGGGQGRASALEDTVRGGKTLTRVWEPTTPGGVQSHSKHQSSVNCVPSDETLLLLPRSSPNL